MADNKAAREQEEAPVGMVTGLNSKQITSRPISYNRKVQGQMEFSDSPIYQEVRKRGKKAIRDKHKPPVVGGDKCESGVTMGMLKVCMAEEEEDSDTERDIERQEGKREVEKFLAKHDSDIGEIVGGPANERRMRHVYPQLGKPSLRGFTLQKTI
eukprot:6189120-Pleurochrysis_carterae.AAC.1